MVLPDGETVKHTAAVLIYALSAITSFFLGNAFPYELTRDGKILFAIVVVILFSGGTLLVLM